MKYAQHRSTMYGRRHIIPWKIIFGILFCSALIIIFLIIRNDDEENSAEATQIVETERNQQELDIQLVQVEATNEQTYQEIDLSPVDGSGSSAIARRGQSEDLFTHVIVASLPPIDISQYYYEGWLVQPGIVKYFSTGELFSREDGKWGLVWENNIIDIEGDVYDYSQVVVTLEERDDDATPSAHHVLEGEF